MLWADLPRGHYRLGIPYVPRAPRICIVNNSHIGVKIGRPDDSYDRAIRERTVAHRRCARGD